MSVMFRALGLLPGINTGYDGMVWYDTVRYSTVRYGMVWSQVQEKTTGPPLCPARVETNPTSAYCLALLLHCSPEQTSVPVPSQRQQSHTYSRSSWARDPLHTL